MYFIIVDLLLGLRAVSHRAPHYERRMAKSTSTAGAWRPHALDCRLFADRAIGRWPPADPDTCPGRWVTDPPDPCLSNGPGQATAPAPWTSGSSCGRWDRAGA